MRNAEERMDEVEDRIMQLAVRLAGISKNTVEAFDSHRAMTKRLDAKIGEQAEAIKRLVERVAALEAGYHFHDPAATSGKY